MSDTDGGMISPRQTLIGCLEEGLLIAGPCPVPTLEAAVLAAGLPFRSAWSHYPMPLAAWAATYGDDHASLDLALHLDDSDTFAMAFPPDGVRIEACYDPTWTADSPCLGLIDIPDVAPLAFGEDLDAVPDPLAKALRPDGDLRLMAVIDAATLPGLEARLAPSGLEYQCLFKGDAADEMGDVAPWLVALPPDAALLRALLTSDAAGGHHGLDAALFLQVDGALADVAAHLRHYTKLPMDTGEWFYFRYWDRLFRTWVRHHPQGPFPRGFWGPRPGAPRAVIGRTTDRDWVIATPPDAADTLPHQGFLPAYRRHSRVSLRRRFLDRLSDALDQTAGIDIEPTALARHYREARDDGYRRERALARRIEAGLLMAAKGRSLRDLDGQPDFQAVQHHSDVHRAGALVRLAREVAA